MKNSTLLILFSLLITFSFASPIEEESSYESAFISYNVEIGRGEVYINLDIKNISQYSEIRIVRSDNPVRFFRQVKYLNNEKIQDLTGNDVIVDKYPLPSATPAYYKVVTIDEYGVQKTYPSVKVSF